ncbi:GPW/gp25 family protein [Paenibacillus thailandensis]|uniref:GPW/gp25 family protein n=1 Tax=Paenibacillus thailandensis TaxID=393250 RepID=A0ABW5QY45_9BACL
MEQSGSGWPFPVVVDKAGGSLPMTTYEQDVAQAIHIILFTAKGERVMRPDFGCGIHTFVFEETNTSTLGLMESAVRDALVKWEPRIEVEAVDAQSDRSGSGRLTITLRYRIRSTGERYTAVYPVS